MVTPVSLILTSDDLRSALVYPEEKDCLSRRVSEPHLRSEPDIHSIVCVSPLFTPFVLMKNVNMARSLMASANTDIMSRILGFDIAWTVYRINIKT